MNQSTNRILAREPTSAGEWASRIAGAWTKAAAAILETGNLLNEAKRALPHGEFARMLETSDLPFSDRTAQRLMAIARHPVLSDPTHVSLLPPAWSTLSALCQLPRETLRLKLESGAIHPGLQRGQVRGWRTAQTAQDVDHGPAETVGRAPVTETATANPPKVDRVRDGKGDTSLLDTATSTDGPSRDLREAATEVGGVVDLNTADEADYFGILCAVWDAASENVREQFLVRIDAEPACHSLDSESMPATDARARVR